jgi:histidinol-phosphate aminotransferase
MINVKNTMLTGPFLERPNVKINLCLNESAYPLPESIKSRLVASLDRLHEYPLGAQEKTIERIARHYDAPAEGIAMTRGVDEAEDRLIELFPRMRYVIFQPTFLGYEARLRLSGVNYVVLPLDGNFDVRASDFARIDENDFVILANPNNPTGTMLAPQTVKRLIERCGKLFVDEAYIDYSGRESLLRRASDDLLVFRSLSKTFALAGQRLGILFGGASTIGAIRNRQWFCNIDLLSLDLVTAILEETFMAEWTARIVEDRARMIAALRAMGFGVRESFTNFVLLRSVRAQAIVAELRERGISVMDTAVFGLPDHVRITVGTPEQNEVFLAAMRELASAQELGVGGTAPGHRSTSASAEGTPTPLEWSTNQ